MKVREENLTRRVKSLEKSFKRANLLDCIFFASILAAITITNLGAWRVATILNDKIVALQVMLSM